jgi:FAD/FMN-containing dehydrogenase
MASARGIAMTLSDVGDLKSRFGGTLLQPSDQGYDTARQVFNAMIDRRPALIAQCKSVADVTLIVNFARERGSLLSVRCAGHNVAGFAVCDDGIVIDLSRMKRISVDAEARSVLVEAGCTWGEVTDALQPHGLAATGGFVSVTGVSGLTLGGGFGWLVRKHGLAIDNILSAEVLLADGSRVTASSTENEDLFWGLRGGGGNFGIVTSFTFRTHAAGTVLGGIVVHPIAAAPGLLRHWRDFEAGAPDELTQGAMLFHFANDPSVPEPMRGAAVIAAGGVYAGSIEEGQKVLAPFRAFGPPVADLFQPMPYNAAQRMADFLWPSGNLNYWKSCFLESLSDAVIGVITDFFTRVPSPRTVVVLESLGNSSIQRFSESSTAFVERRYPFNFLITSAWSSPAESDQNIRWTKQFYEAMQPYAAKAAYVNYIGDEGSDGVRRAYGDAKLLRLGALKAKYDPGNLFRMNQNIQPTTRR